MENENENQNFLPVPQGDWKPGIHTGVHDEVYHATFPGVSHHDLLNFEISPGHYVYAKANPSEQTDAMKLGSAVHCALLEPKRFARDYVGLPPDYDGRKKMGIALMEGLLEQGFKKENILKYDEIQAIKGIKDSIFDSRIVRAFFDAADHFEVTLFWQDKETGIFCRGRVDLTASKYGAAVDLKSAQKGGARTAVFSKDVETRLYYRQAAYYLDGLKALGMDINKFVFLVVEKTGPFASNKFELDPELIAIGRAENRTLLNRYAECLDSDSWPAYPDSIEMIVPSSYMRNRTQS